jgi:hypothetical protein
VSPYNSTLTDTDTDTVIRISELFDIIVDYPDSINALTDLQVRLLLACEKVVHDLTGVHGAHDGPRSTRL